MKTKLVSWAYPSSDHAVKLGFAKTGCYVVEYCDMDTTFLAIPTGFVSRAEAIRMADGLACPFNWMQRLKINQPDFKP